MASNTHAWGCGREGMEVSNLNLKRKSVLEAIKEGVWDYEPEEVDQSRYDATRAMPGTDEKLTVLAERVQAGLPLWHESDRTDYDESEE